LQSLHGSHAVFLLFAVHIWVYFPVTINQPKRVIMFPEDHPLNGPHPTDCGRN